VASILEAGGSALSRAAQIEQRQRELRAENQALARERRNDAKKRQRMGEKLRGMDDGAVLEVLGLRRIAQEKAARKAEAKAAAQTGTAAQASTAAASGSGGCPR
jgi:hypothetical protein